MQEGKLQDAAQRKGLFDPCGREATGRLRAEVRPYAPRQPNERQRRLHRLPTQDAENQGPDCGLTRGTHGPVRERQMQMAENNADLGPISYLVVEFPGSKMTGEGLPILVDLVDRGIIRILDLVFVAKAQDGSLGIIGLADLDHDGTIDLAVFEGASSGLVSQEDLDDAAPVIAPGSSAAILIFENRWATSFVQALRRSDAQLVAAGYIPQDDLAAALDAAGD
jgi:hypothetical protein